MSNAFPNNPTFLALARRNDDAEVYYRENLERLRKENKEYWDRHYAASNQADEVSYYSTHQHLGKPTD